MSERLNIIIDTREQTPWAFPVWAADVNVGTLRTGDYALSGDAGFAVERKSLDDFLSTLSSGWERFGRELERMDSAQFPAKVIIVESDFAAIFFGENGSGIVAPDHRHPMLSPAFITKRVAELALRGAMVIFAGNRDCAAALAYHILKERNYAITCQS